MENVKITIALIVAVLLQWTLRNVAEPFAYIDFPLITVVYAALQRNSVKAILFGTIAGIAVVGNPAQCAATLQQFIDAGCHSFCLSGYLHDEEAERFGRLIRPVLAEKNRNRWAA